jgi:DNA-binding CsgD family transcriptional regulator
MTKPEYNIEERTSELESQTILSERQAQVQALYERGASRDEMAAELDVTLGTIDSHRARVEKKLHLARRTVGEIGTDCVGSAELSALVEYIKAGGTAE